MVRHKNFQIVIVPLTLEAAFYSIFTFNFRFNRALISHSGAMLRHRNFQSVIGPLNSSSTPSKQHFIFFLILVLIGHYSVVQVLLFDIEISKA